MTGILLFVAVWLFTAYTMFDEQRMVWTNHDSVRWREDADMDIVLEEIPPIISHDPIIITPMFIEPAITDVYEYGDN